MKIVSGGQTGADRAALDWAIDHGIHHGGWCPEGRHAEDGTIPARYRLQELPGASYRQRTRANVLDSDATLIISLSAELTGGSRETARFAQRFGKPCLHVHPAIDWSPILRQWIADTRIQTLNVAGPRASTQPGIEAFVARVLDAVLAIELER